MERFMHLRLREHRLQRSATFTHASWLKQTLTSSQQTRFMSNSLLCFFLRQKKEPQLKSSITTGRSTLPRARAGTQTWAATLFYYFSSLGGRERGFYPCLAGRGPQQPTLGAAGHNDVWKLLIMCRDPWQPKVNGHLRTGLALHGKKEEPIFPWIELTVPAN